MDAGLKCQTKLTSANSINVASHFNGGVLLFYAYAQLKNGSGLKML